MSEIIKNINIGSIDNKSLNEASSIIENYCYIREIKIQPQIFKNHKITLNVIIIDLIII